MAATAASSSSSTPTLDVNNSTGTSHVSFAEGTAAATPVTPLTSTSNVSAAGDTRRRSFIESARKSIDGVRSAIVGHLPHLPGLPRKSTEFSRRSTDRSGLSDGDDGLLELAGYEGMWILDRAVSESDDGLLKMQGCSMWVGTKRRIGRGPAQVSERGGGIRLEVLAASSLGICV